MKIIPELLLQNFFSHTTDVRIFRSKLINRFCLNYKQSVKTNQFYVTFISQLAL